MKKMGDFLLHSNLENLKVNKKGFSFKIMFQIALGIILLIVIVTAVVKLFLYLTGM